MRTRRVQALERVARQADDIADVLTLAPANQALAAEAGVAPHDDPHPGPSLTQTRRFYSENEFDLGRLSYLRPRIIEAGRACIHTDYRSGGVIMMLWAGLAACMQREKAEFLIGCASVSLADGGHTINALYRKLAADNLCPPEYRVTPHLPFPLHDEPLPEGLQVPALIKGYLRSGAWVCGEPAWDPDFHSADLFMMLPLQRLDSRYARHYLKEMESA